MMHGMYDNTLQTAPVDLDEIRKLFSSRRMGYDKNPLSVEFAVPVIWQL